MALGGTIERISPEEAALQNERNKISVQLYREKNVATMHLKAAELFLNPADGLGSFKEAHRHVSIADRALERCVALQDKFDALRAEKG